MDIIFTEKGGLTFVTKCLLSQRWGFPNLQNFQKRFINTKQVLFCLRFKTAAMQHTGGLSQSINIVCGVNGFTLNWPP